MARDPPRPRGLDMPSGLREVRDLPPEGDPQFPPNGPAQHHLSQAGSVQASRYGPSGKQGSGSLTGRRQIILLCSMRCSLCSLRSRLHPALAPSGSTLKAEPHASGGPHGHGMARVTNPHAVKPEGVRQHGVTARRWYGLPLRCPCGGGGPGAGVVRGSVRRGRRRRRRFPHL